MSGTPPVALGWRDGAPVSVPSGVYLSDEDQSTGVGVVLLDRLGQKVRWTTPTVQLQASISTNAEGAAEDQAKDVTLSGSSSFFIPATGNVDLDVGALGEPQDLTLRIRSQGFRPSMSLADANFELRVCEPGWGPFRVSLSANESRLYAFTANSTSQGSDASLQQL